MIDISALPADVAAPTLRTDLLDRVTAALHIPPDISASLDGLRLVYAAWCANVPFDNIRKMISLRSGNGSQLPGLDAEDFFENWLANRSGGTCWPSSNALYTLLTSLGFNARRVAGCMFDLGIVNHGTIKVTLDGEDWMVDTSMLTSAPLPMHRGIYIHDDPKVGVEVEPVDGSHVVWIDFVPLPNYVPCRLRFDPVDTDFYHERYEVFSRQQSPFNDRLYLRHGGPDGACLVLGNTKFARTRDGLDVKEFTRDELCSFLHEEAGISSALLDEWIASGSLDSSLDPSTQGPVPEINGLPPSRR